MHNIGQGLEDKSAETGSRVTTLGVGKDRETYKGTMGVMPPDNSLTGGNRDGKKAAGNIWTEEMNTGIEDEEDHWTEERKEVYVLGYRIWQHTHTEESSESTRKGAGFVTMGYTRLRERESETGHCWLV